jgi:hypothetical protein
VPPCRDTKFNVVGVGNLYRRLEADKVVKSSGEWHCVVDAQNLEKVLNGSKFGRKAMAGTANYLFCSSFEMRKPAHQW